MNKLCALLYHDEPKVCTHILYWTMLICSIYWWGGYVVSPNPMWLVMAHDFSPHFKIGFAFMSAVHSPLVLVTLHHVGNLLSVLV